MPVVQEQGELLAPRSITFVLMAGDHGRFENSVLNPLRQLSPAFELPAPRARRQSVVGTHIIFPA
jgi:hypothetical protein